ncbi:MAG: hypothetical protein ACRCXZ_07965, partial [Patescibacteria group bacterium]
MAINPPILIMLQEESIFNSNIMDVASNSQSSTGDYSPNLNNITGPVTINYNGVEYKLSINQANIGLETIHHDQFIGRVSLVKELSTMLADINSTSRFLILRSMGGIGKTYLTKYLSSITIKNQEGVGCFYHTIFIECSSTNGTKINIEDTLFGLFKSYIFNQDSSSITSESKEPFVR